MSFGKKFDRRAALRAAGNFVVFGGLIGLVRSSSARLMATNLPTQAELSSINDARGARAGGAVLSIRDRKFTEEHEFSPDSLLVDVEFENCNFVRHTLNGASFKSVKFRDCRFIDVDWKCGSLGDVEFTECHFYGGDTHIEAEKTFGASKYVRCYFEGHERSRAYGTVIAPGQCVFDHCEFHYTDVNVADGVSFVGCTMSPVGVIPAEGRAGMVELSDCRGSVVKFIQDFSAFVFTKVDIGKIDMLRTNVASVQLVKSRCDLQMLGATVEKFTADECVFVNGSTVLQPNDGGGLGLEQASVNSVTVSNCTFEGPNARAFALGEAQPLDKQGHPVPRLGADRSVIPYHATFGKVVWRNTPMTASEWRFASVASLTIEDSTVSDSNFTSADIGEVVFKNVRLAGTVDFSNAKVKKTTAQGMVRDPKLKLVTTGSSLALSL